MANLINAETGEIILTEFVFARSFWKRFVGLMFRKSLPQGFGIWIMPCKSVHTMWMRISIDIHFLDSNNSVIEIRKNVQPWRVVLAPKNTESVLEIGAGAIEIPRQTRIEAS
jgi:hypothetical protein|tara:strand:+ start:118 stop:453 length:336 start_codon:yes stop_codon:yes gene_type:complete